MKSRRLVKESYEVSEELANRLNSILADEFLAAEFYRLAELAMKGNKQHRLSEIADENGEDELEDHFKNLSEWMQSKGIRVVTNHDEMLDITNGSVFTVEDGDSTKDIVDKLIQSEEEAIEAYENLIPDTDLDLHTMLCGFLKDEREHLKALQDCRDEMGDFGGEEEDYDDEEDSEPEEVSSDDNQDDGEEDIGSEVTVTANESSKSMKKRMNEEFDYDPKSYGDDVKFRVYDIAWEDDAYDSDEDLPDEVEVDVPAEIVDYGDEEDFISDWLYDEYGYSAEGFETERAGSDGESGYKFKVWNISWDTDGEDVDLPTELTVTVPEEVFASDGEEDYISDWLSDEYGFCHNGFLFKEI